MGADQVTNAKEIAEIVAAVAKEVPIYQDALQPAAKEVGKALGTVAKLLNVAVSPFTFVNWSFEKILDYCKEKLPEKLKDIPAQNIVVPTLQIVGPVFEAMRFSGDDINLRDLYLNLLATAMNKETIHKAHPGFVEVIKNMSSDEAILLQAFTQKTYYPSIEVRVSHISESESTYSIVESNFTCLNDVISISRPDLLQVYIANLVRLGILITSSAEPLGHEDLYNSLKNSKEMIQLKNEIESMPNQKFVAKGGLLSLTVFGKQFVDNVVSFLNSSDNKNDLRFGYPGLVLA